MSGLIRCNHCGHSVRPNPRLREQRYCGDKRCQRVRKTLWQRQKMATDADYQANQRESQRRWLMRNRGKIGDVPDISTFLKDRPASGALGVQPTGAAGEKPRLCRNHPSPAPPLHPLSHGGRDLERAPPLPLKTSLPNPPRN